MGFAPLTTATGSRETGPALLKIRALGQKKTKFCEHEVVIVKRATDHFACPKMYTGRDVCNSSDGRLGIGGQRILNESAPRIDRQILPGDACGVAEQGKISED